MSSIKRLGVSEARKNLSHIIEEAYHHNTRFILERNQIPLAIVIGIEDCKQLLEDYQDLKDMIKALKAPKDEWINYNEYRQERLARVRNKVSKKSSK